MEPNPRCVLDTNVLISAALFPERRSGRILDWTLQHGILLASVETFQELESVIVRKKFDRYLDQDFRTWYLNLILQSATFIVPTETITACSDPDDDKFLELALSGHAHYLITGNIKDFPTSPFRGLEIVTPAIFDELIAP